eukprot:TRINITY_DN7970_c0_g4_i2.p1 TRINITY_DN7970_c0_g4~~TRINITY_DN7970_c0_g4_i2.p1  ORF type:complete len:176 (-),score=62.08 TRINITY_DN7970_c0_g4_i2:18-545(-)
MCPRELTKSWWKRETQSNVRYFLSLLIDCIEVFEIQPETEHLSRISQRFSRMPPRSAPGDNNSQQNTNGRLRNALYRQSVLNSQKLLTKTRSKGGSHINNSSSSSSSGGGSNIGGGSSFNNRRFAQTNQQDVATFKEVVISSSISWSTLWISSGTISSIPAAATVSTCFPLCCCP